MSFPAERPFDVCAAGVSCRVTFRRRRGGSGEGGRERTSVSGRERNMEVKRIGGRQQWNVKQVKKQGGRTEGRNENVKYGKNLRWKERGDGGKK